MTAYIQYGSEDLITGYHSVVDQVARETVYIEMVEAHPFERMREFQKKLMAHDWPVYYAVANGRVVGWADASVSENPRMAHRGFLGMGLLKEWRGQGLGTQLLQAVIAHARRIGLEKLELTVYTDNEAAIRLYRQQGFTDIGVNRHFRKYAGRYFDGLEMELFLQTE